MNYDQLKDLSPQDLLTLLHHTLNQSIIIATLPEPQSPHDNPLPPPALCQIGDFQISARFYNPPPSTTPSNINPTP